MRSKNMRVGAAAFVAVALGAASCSSSGSKAPASHPTSAATTTAAALPATSQSPGPFSADQLQAALLSASTWGSGWTDIKEGPLVKTSGLGAVTDIAAQDCWTTVYAGGRTGSLTSVEDIVDSGTGDIAHQNAYQFRPGEAAVGMSQSAKKVDGCGTFKHTDDNKSAFTVQASEQPVPGLGDQATKTTVQSVSAQNGVDVLVDLRVRYGDVVIDVGYDSAIATTALAYDLSGKAGAIASKLGLKSAGS